MRYHLPDIIVEEDLVIAILYSNLECVVFNITSYLSVTSLYLSANLEVEQLVTRSITLYLLLDCIQGTAQDDLTSLLTNLGAKT
jgi:hypothetical protein